MSNMKQTVSEWFAGLDQEDRKKVVSCLFAIRLEAQKLRDKALFNELLKRLDDEYHSLKG